MVLTWESFFIETQGQLAYALSLEKRILVFFDYQVIFIKIIISPVFAYGKIGGM